MDQATDPTKTTAAGGLTQRLAGRLGLSAKLLVLTILFVMIAEVLIYVPSVANFRLNWLRDKLSDAYTAALVLEATPDVPDELTQQVLDSISARAVAMKMGQQRRLLMVGDMPPMVDHEIDLRDVSWHGAIIHAFAVLLSRGDDVIRVLGHAPRGGEFVEVVFDEKPLRAAMLQFSGNILVLSLIISAITATLVYLALHYLFVRPLYRITANMTTFRDDPENPSRVIVASRRQDEIGITERELAGMQRELGSLLQQKNRLAALGLAVSKINHDLRNLLTSAQLFSDRLLQSQDQQVQRFAPKLMRALERAIQFCESTLSYGRAQEAPPDRRPIALEPLVAEVRELLGVRARHADPLDRRGRARADRRRRSRPAVPRPAQSCAQCGAGAGEPRRARSRPRPDPHHRPARGRGGRDRGVRYRARHSGHRPCASVRAVQELEPLRRQRAWPRHRRRTGARP